MTKIKTFEEAIVHRLPVSLLIAKESPKGENYVNANVNAYFKITKVPDESKPKDNLTEIDNGDLYQSTFRGRRLRGRKISIPKGYKGLIIEKSEQVKVLNEFKEINVWDHDRVPSLPHYHFLKTLSILDMGIPNLVANAGKGESKKSEMD